MSDITFVVPKPTPIALGGRPFFASELRLDDLAALQAYVKAQVPSPYDEAWDGLALAADEGRAWKRLVSETIDAQEAYPPEPGDPASNAILASPAGRKALLALALRREHDAEEIAEACSRYDEITLEEYARLVRVAWGSDPMRSLALLVDGPPRDSPSPDWGLCWFDYLTTAVNGPAFAELTISQFTHFRAKGSPSRGLVSGPGAEGAAARRRAFFAELGTEPIPAEPEVTIDALE